MKSDVLAEPVLVGRDRELDELQRCLDSAIQGKGTTVFVSGDAGSGKTRLISEFLKIAKKKNTRVMAGWCLSDTEIPFFPFIEAFNTYFTSLDQVEEYHGMLPQGNQFGLGESFQDIGIGREVATLLTGAKTDLKLGKPEAISPQVWKDQAFAAVTRTLQEISSQATIIMVLEDIHWADSASLSLLHYIARVANNSEQILVLATFRSEELTADTEGYPHPLAETLRIMRREDLFTEIKLPDLTKVNVSQIAENMIKGHLESEFAEKLSKESRGNPLFVVESLRMLHERKSLIKEKDQWRLSIDEFSIPSKIKDIILRRLAVLKYAQRRILDAASVIGEKFDVELLSTVLGLDILEVLETLNVIAHSTALVSVEENRYRFDHARSKETLYEELSAPLKRGYHNRIAEKLENNKVKPLPLSDLAYHYAQAGNTEKSIAYSLAAATDELAKFSNSQAIKHFKYVLQNIPDDLKYQEEKRIALEGLGDAYNANSMYLEAIKTFEELAASQTGAVKLRAFRKAMDAAFLKGDKAEVLLEYARKAEKLAAFDRLEMARVLDDRGRAFGFAGRGKISSDQADYEAALKIFEEENSLPDVADALWRSGATRACYKESRAKGIGRILRSIAIYKELGDIKKEVQATLYLGTAFLFSGLFSEAQKDTVKFFKVGEKTGNFNELAQATNGLSMFLSMAGKKDEAISKNLEALTYWRKTDVEWLGAKIYSELAIQYVKLGDLKKAEECFEKISAFSPESLMHMGNAFAISRAKKFLNAAKKNWQLSNEPTYVNPDSVQIVIREIERLSDYAWILKKQGKDKESNAQVELIQIILENAQESFKHTSLQANLMTQREIQTGEEFEMRLDLVNVSRSPGVLIKIENFIPSEFSIVDLSQLCILNNHNIEFKKNVIGAFEVVTIKFILKALKPGVFCLEPQVRYVDELGETQTCVSNQVTITVCPAKPRYEVLPGRVSTGFEDLDALLLGGIPKKYAVVLSSSSNEERQLVIKNFLEVGARSGETTFYLTSEVGTIGDLAEECKSNFFLLVCNPQADAMVQSLPNVFKLKGIENLTEISITVVKAFRNLKDSDGEQRRICIDLVSDVLLQHHALITRKWLSALLPTLKSHDFTVLAIVNPLMHSQEDLQAILGLFDGEIRIKERETAKGAEKILKVKRLSGQKYADNELILNRKKWEQ